ncbi:MAG: methylenetetrahydrofolate reductase [NAD(P)H] [Rhodobacteraceae bacterium]|nr:methylenetetrahydrofolate reductase [NAD(P)H] [Paracoccaceae bacterium]
MQVRSQDERPRRFQDPGAKPPLSFEMYPPRSAKGRRALAETTRRLAGVASAGFSVTMGAGGSAPSGTHETALEIAQISGRPVMAHLIAQGHSRAETLRLADGFWQDGITQILALRGDPPSADQAVKKGGFSHASQLVAALRDRHDFRISVAAYPEKHPQARSLDDDIDHLKEKLDAGATDAICQFVLDPAAYARFVDACGRRGVTAPLIPGLMPLENWPRVRAFAMANETRVPRRLDRLFGAFEEESEARRLAAMAVVAEQARQLVAYGAPALHIYALNRWQMPLALAQVLQNADQAAALGLR